MRTAIGSKTPGVAQSILPSVVLALLSVFLFAALFLGQTIVPSLMQFTQGPTVWHIEIRFITLSNHLLSFSLLLGPPTVACQFSTLFSPCHPNVGCLFCFVVPSYTFVLLGCFPPPWRVPISLQLSSFSISYSPFQSFLHKSRVPPNRSFRLHLSTSFSLLSFLLSSHFLVSHVFLCCINKL